MARINRLKGITLNGVALDSQELPGNDDPEIKEVLAETLKEMKGSAKRRFISSCGSKMEKNGPVKIWTAEEIQKVYGPSMKQKKDLNPLYQSILTAIERNGPCSVTTISADVGSPNGQVQSRLSFLFQRLHRFGIEGLNRKLNPEHGGRGHVYWIEGTTADELMKKWVSVKGKSAPDIPGEAPALERPLGRSALPIPSWRDTERVKTLVESIKDHPNWGIDREEPSHGHHRIEALKQSLQTTQYWDNLTLPPDQDDTTTKMVSGPCAEHLEEEAPVVPSGLLTDLAEAIKEGRIDLNDIVSMLSVQHRRDTEKELDKPRSSVVESLAGKIKVDVDVKVTFCFSTSAKS